MNLKNLLTFIISLLITINCAFSVETIILNSETIKQYYPKIGLALGGGSARGFAHLGVLRTLEKEKIPLAMISGTSMGSIMGGLFAQGYSTEEIENILKDMDFDSFFSTEPALKKIFQSKYIPWFTFFQKEPVGVFNSYQVEEFLRKYTLAGDFQNDFDFDRYPVAYRAVATNFMDGSEKVFTKGPLYQAVAASITIPFIFKPYYLDGNYYIDGGISELVPVSPLKAAKMDYIIAVNVLALNTTDEDALYQPHAYTWHFNDILVTKLGQETFRQADLLVSLPASSNLSINDYQKFPAFIKTGEQLFQPKMQALTEFIENFDKRSEIIVLNKIENQTDLALPGLAKGNYYKNKLLRIIYNSAFPQEVVLEFNKNEDGTSDLTIKEDATKKIKHVLVEGNQTPLDKETEAALKDFEGKFDSPETRIMINKIINKFYQEKGIFLFDSKINLKNNVLNIYISEARVNEINIEGNHYIPSNLIKKFVKLNTPAVYNQYQIEHIVRSLYGTDLFYSVKPLVKKEPKGNGVILTLEVKEKDRGVVFFSGQYFSTEKDPEFELGYHDYFTTLHWKPYLVLRSGQNYGGAAGFELYNLADTNLGLGINYQKMNHNIDLYNSHSHKLETDFIFEEEWTDLMLTYTSYDYIYFSAGQRQKRYLLTEVENIDLENDNAKNYRPVILQVQFNNLDQEILPNSGIKTSVLWEENGQIDNKLYPKKDIFSWLAYPLESGSLWWKYKDVYSPADAPAYLWSAPNRDLLPNGFRYNEVFSSHYIYHKFSYINKFVFGSFYEFSADRTKFIDSYNSWYETTGLGAAIYYPSFIGLFSLGYGSTDFNYVYYLNLSKGL